MKIILPYFIYKYFLHFEPYPKWMLFELKNYKLIPTVMGASFKSLLPYLYKNDSQN